MNFEKARPHIPLKNRINVIFEDESIIVIEKASGILSQPVKGSNEPSAVELIRHYWKAKKLKQCYIGVVHRLDQETSGLIVFAKSKVSQRILQQQFATHKVTKRYMAIVSGIPDRTRGRLVGTMTRNKAGKRTVVSESSKGKESITRYKVLEQLTDKALLEIAPETGRTHQIRVQLASIGYALVGDSVYGFGKKRTKHYSRCFLHASKLGFIHPRTAKRVLFESALPPDMQKIVEEEKKKKSGAQE